MFQNALRRLSNETRSFQTSVKYVHFLRGVGPLRVSARHLTDVKDAQPFDTSLLEFLVCPLSKKQLRYEEKTNELINEELGIAYPIVNGIPNMIPTDARLIKNDPETLVEPAQSHKTPNTY
ncbi:hypothetical protein J4Q44_G00090650 [Coregonus suidteri]|uniref:Protein preY, mitochondrial n=1 Tax=Coregonus suidteri TaxID=861788 RepID=A0AAN8LYK7_9TELE